METDVEMFLASKNTIAHMIDLGMKIDQTSLSYALSIIY